MEYITIVCDIKNSKNIKNRESIQYQLIKTIKEANEFFATNIAAPFLIILGDEWQGLLNYPCDYTAILDFFHKKMEGIDFYCGIGIGEVAIHNFELTVNQLDGPSFYKARKAIRVAKQNNYNVVCIH